MIIEGEYTYFMSTHISSFSFSSNFLFKGRKQKISTESVFFNVPAFLGHILPGQVYSQPYSSIHSSVIPPLIPSNSSQPSSHSIQLHSGGAGIHGSIQGLQRGSGLQGGPIQGLQGGPGGLNLVRGNSNGSATANTSSYNGSQGTVVSKIIRRPTMSTYGYICLLLKIYTPIFLNFICCFGETIFS